ncbi:coiled-coil domain-containing protein 154 [Dasypus novemcinctus]|uniref:coiled-coil domain-containing protein 154 n=1 Tax=Dasypus novemcinctus TaxID=9361 RepID=UPI00265E0631|nr:coiled-coil domain-containing protein 154 [Dasypus novemcinctus]
MVAMPCARGVICVALPAILAAASRLKLSPGESGSVASGWHPSAQELRVSPQRLPLPNRPGLGTWLWAAPGPSGGGKATAGATGEAVSAPPAGGRRGSRARPLAAELADASSLSWGVPPASRPSTATLEDLGLLLAEGLASPVSPSPEGLSERYESSRLASSASIPEQDTPGRWKQLEQWVADLQAEVACLRGHEDRCERAMLSLLQELLQVRAQVQAQDAELRRLQQAARAPERDACELASSPSQNQIQALDRRLVEVREALTQIRRKQALQDSERRSTGQEVDVRLTKVMGQLKQEAQAREAACSALQKSQEDASQRVDHEVAKMQVQVAQLGEEMSLRFLKREAKLCSFLQKSFLAIEKKMKASESSRAKAESSLWEELESRWRRIQELNEERARALQGQREEESHVLEQCRGLDQAVGQLTKFVRQNQVSLNRVLQARDAQDGADKSPAGELAGYLQESLEAARAAGELAQRETQGALALLREKSRALEVSVAELGGQVKDLSQHLLALTWKLDLHEQTLGLRLAEVKNEWEGAERRSLEDLARWQKEAEAHLRDVRERVDSLPRQIESISDKCVLHKSDSDLKISAEGKAREFAVEAVRQELAVLLASMQHLKEDNPSRKVAEIQGKLTTFQNQLMKLENSIQDNKTIQNLKFNTETRQREEEMASLRESTLRLWSEEGPWALTPGGRRVLLALVRQRFFVKDVAPGEELPVNRWGVYQAARWLRWKAALMGLAPPERPRGLGPRLQAPPPPLSPK